jgi:RimJ/RimL family protein N-acetyltransferase
MTDHEVKVLKEIDIETFIKSLTEETIKWGFDSSDYMKIVNALLDLSLNKISNHNTASKKIKYTGKVIEFPVKGEHILLRKFINPKDLLKSKEWLSDENGRWFLLSSSYLRQRTIEEVLNDERNILSVIQLDNSVPIGLMGFLDIDKVHRKAEMRKLIGEKEFRGKGYAKEATMLWIEYGLNTLGLKKIYINTIESDIRNITLNRELGFSIEGFFRNECYVDGKFYNILRMALLAD